MHLLRDCPEPLLMGENTFYILVLYNAHSLRVCGFRGFFFCVRVLLQFPFHPTRVNINEKNALCNRPPAG